MKRRNFVHTMVTTGIAVSMGAQARAAETKTGEMLYRTLGQTGEKVSAIGLGGYHIGVPEDEQESIRIIRSAIDRGITFMDNCWDYHNGGSEIRMGKALRDGYRDKVFLMTKIDGRTKQLAGKQIDESLQRLQTDRIDLMQHHEVIRMEDPDRIFAEKVRWQPCWTRRKPAKFVTSGSPDIRIRWITCRTLEIAAQHHFRFDAVQMPLNVMDAHFRSFEHKVLPVLVKEGIGVLGMKPLGSGAILQSKSVTAIECLHYALNLPTSVVITGIDSMGFLDQALEAVRTFKRMTKTQVATLLSRTAQAAATGKYELFKTTPAFDATAQHLEWLG